MVCHGYRDLLLIIMTLIQSEVSFLLVYMGGVDRHSVTPWGQDFSCLIFETYDVNWKDLTFDTELDLKVVGVQWAVHI